MMIRNCTSADREAVNRLMYQSSVIHGAGVPDFFAPNSESFTEEQFTGVLQDPNGCLFCAEEDGAVRGICHLSFREVSGLIRLKNAHVENIVVDEACRGQGIGHLLMAEAERRAREWGAVHLNLLCWNFNDGARRLYESLGMEPMFSMMKKDL